MGPQRLVTFVISALEMFLLTYLGLSVHGFWLVHVVDGFCMWDLGTFSNILLSSLSSFNPSFLHCQYYYIQNLVCFGLAKNGLLHSEFKWEDCDWVPIYRTYTTLYWPLSQFSNRHIMCFHKCFMFTFSYRYLKRIRLTRWVCFHGQYNTTYGLYVVYLVPMTLF